MAKTDFPPGVLSSTPIRYPVIFGPDGLPVKVLTSEGELPFRTGQPMTPRIVSPGPPRAFVPPPLSNMTARPRVQSGVPMTPFDILREMATYDLIRIVMEDLKGQAKGLNYNVVPESGSEKEAEGPAMQADITRARRWMEMPDPIGQECWDDWITKLLEETLVTDALTLCPRRTIGKEPLGLEVIDGAKITVLADSRGKPPAPPSVAFQQIAYGMPERNFYVRRCDPETGEVGQGVEIDNELWYLPRNRRANTLYGYAEVERVLVTANLAIRQELYDLSYFTDGTLPEGFYAIREGRTDVPMWGPDQLRELEEAYNAKYAGRDDLRSGALRLMPDGTYVSVKERDWDYEFLEFMGRVIAWAFNVSPAMIMKNMGRNPVEGLEKSTLESGVKPLAKFIARVCTRYIKQELGLVNLKMEVAKDSVEDPTSVSQRHVAYVQCIDPDGVPVMTSNEVRDELGLDPLDVEAYKQAKAEADAAANPFGAGGGLFGEEGKPKQKAPFGQKPKGKDAKDAKGAKAEEEDDVEKHRAALTAELSKMRRSALKAARNGKDPVSVIEQWQSVLVSPGLRKVLADDLRRYAV